MLCAVLQHDRAPQRRVDFTDARLEVRLLVARGVERSVFAEVLVGHRLRERGLDQRPSLLEFFPLGVERVVAFLREIDGLFLEPLRVCTRLRRLAHTQVRAEVVRRHVLLFRPLQERADKIRALCSIRDGWRKVLRVLGDFMRPHLGEILVRTSPANELQHLRLCRFAHTRLFQPCEICACDLFQCAEIGRGLTYHKNPPAC